MTDFSPNTALIEQYLSGELSPVAKAAFEKRLETDEALQKELALHKEINLAVEEEGDKLLKAELDTIHNDFVSLSGKPWWKKGWGLVVIGAAMILISTTALFLSDEMDSEHEENVSDNVVTIDGSKEDITMIYYDSLQDQVIVEHTIKDTVVSQDALQPNSNSTVFLTTYQPSDQATYSFEGSQIKLYNFNHDLKNVDFRKHANKLYLFHDGNYYEVMQGEEDHPLKKVKDVRDFATLKYATGSGPQVVISDRIKYVKLDSTSLVVEPHATLSENQVVFKPEKEKLLLSKQYFQKKPVVRKYSGAADFYTLTVEENTYLLKPGKQRLSLLDFNAVFPVQKRTVKLRHETVEDNYFNQESH